MTTDPQAFDVAMFDALVEGHGNRWYTRGCAVGRFVASLEAGEYRSRLIERLEDPAIGHAAVVHAIRATAGESFRADTMRRHRLGQCSCSDDVRTP